jgi:hypothetical protein
MVPHGNDKSCRTGQTDFRVSVCIGRGGNRGRSWLVRDGVDWLELITEAVAASRGCGREDEEEILRCSTGRGKRDGRETTVRWPIHCLSEIREMLWESI